MELNRQSKLFRYDINALRALAVMGVLFYHFKSRFVAGGFIGVDVFFVISGFLMTRIILEGLINGSFSLTQFYARRLKRIVPPLIALVLAVTVSCYWLYFPADYQETQKSALSSLLFVANFYYLSQSGYFAPSADNNIFLHTWSLSLEWQFYLLYPLLLIGLKQTLTNKRRLLWLLAFAVIVLYLLSVLTTKYYRATSFYVLPTRCWEMLAGGIAYLGQDYFKRVRYHSLIAFSGYTALIACAVLINTKMSWPGKFTWIPVAATMIILCANVNSWGVLHFKPLQFFGKISYSLYLWHWPVYVVLQYVGVPLTPFTLGAMFVLSTLLAALSYNFIEMANYQSSIKILVTAGGAAVIALVLAVTITNSWIFKQQALQMLSFANYDDNEAKALDKNSCFECLTPQNVPYNWEKCMQIDAARKNILLVGDSHAAHLSQPLRAFFAARNVNLLQATATHCLPLSQANGDPRGYRVIDYAYHDFLTKNAAYIDGIIISASWFNNTFQEVPKILTQLKETLNYLGRFNKNVVVLGQSEVYTIPYPTIRAKEIEYNVNLRHKFLNATAHQVNVQFKKQLPGNYIDVYDINDSQTVSAKGEPYMFDNNHYSNYGAALTLSNLLRTPQFKIFIKQL